MSTHNICFHREIRKQSTPFKLKKVSCLELYDLIREGEKYFSYFNLH